MTIQSGSNLYTQGFGSAPENVEIPHVDVRNPTANDVRYPIGKVWVNQTAGQVSTLASISSSAGRLSAAWVTTGGGSGAVATLTGSNSVVVEPNGGNINVFGTSSQITTAGSANTITVSLPSALVAPGSVTATTTVTAGTGITCTLGNITASSGNVSAVGTLGGGTGNVTAAENITAGNNITATSGNISATAGSVGAGTTVTAGTGITATTGDIVSTAGNISAVATGAFVFGSSGVQIVTGTGAPSATLAAGSLYLRQDGSTDATRAYISAGAGSWIAITTAS